MFATTVPLEHCWKYFWGRFFYYISIIWASAWGVIVWAGSGRAFCLFCQLPQGKYKKISKVGKSSSGTMFSTNLSICKIVFILSRCLVEKLIRFFIKYKSLAFLAWRTGLRLSRFMPLSSAVRLSHFSVYKFIWQIQYKAKKYGHNPIVPLFYLIFQARIPTFAEAVSEINKTTILLFTCIRHLVTASRMICYDCYELRRTDTMVHAFKQVVSAYNHIPHILRKKRVNKENICQHNKQNQGPFMPPISVCSDRPLIRSL